MSEENPHLNDYGLLSAIRSLIDLTGRENKLWEAKQEAEKAVAENRALIDGIRKRLGAHTGATKRPEFVILPDGIVAYVPVPRDGYSDKAVYPEFGQAQGFRFIVPDAPKP